MKLNVKITLCFLVALLTACTPQPSSQKILILPINLSQTVWWSKMRDPALNNLITKALNNNHQILAAQANVLQAQSQLKAAYNAWLPTVNASSNGFLVKGWDTDINAQGPLANVQNLGVNNLKVKGGYAGFVPSYSLNILENINNTRLAKASLAVQQATYMSLRLSIISQTAGAYFNLLGQKEQLVEQKHLISDLKKLRRLEEVRYKDGASDYSAVANLDQEIANNRALIASLEASIVQVENSLQLLTNQKPSSIIINKTLSSFSTKNIIPPHLPARFLENRPDLMIAKENLIRSDANLGLAYARFFPQISLTGLLGGSSIELVHLLKLTTGLGIAQVAAAMPIFNGVLYQQIQAAKAGVKAEYYNYIQTLRAALVDVDNSLTKYKGSVGAYHYQEQAYKAALRGYRILSSRYKVGFQDRRVVMNAQLNVDHAKISLIQAKMDQLNSLVSAYQALAGGYI